MEVRSEINNTFYDSYGDRWYTAQDDPIALLRAENRVKLPWIVERIKAEGMVDPTILDVGCGGGFLSNELAKTGFQVTGVDLSPESLKVAEAHDITHSVKYQIADAFHLPFKDESFDVVTAMDFLEHVENPGEVIKEFSRVLRPNGLFFYHTFNRNILSWLMVIKSVELLVKNTPKNMHILKLFIKPRELIEYCRLTDMDVYDTTGIRPVLTSITPSSLVTGIVPIGMKFKLTKGELLSYMGVARKILQTQAS